MKFLDITLDHKLNFNQHFTNIKNQCLPGLSFLNNYLVNNKKLTQLYKSLIRFKIEYSFLPSLEAIQNNAFRIILIKDCNYGNAKLRIDSNTVTIAERTKNWFMKTSSDLQHPVSIIKHQYKYFPEYDSRITLFEI